MIKVFILMVSISYLFADWCIYHAAQRKIYDHEDRLFYKNFPKGSIVKENGLYKFRSGPYLTKKAALKYLILAKKWHKDAYIKPCRPTKKRAQKIETVKKEQSNIEKKETSFVDKIVKHLSKKNERNSYTLTFEEFLHRLLKYDYQARNIDYQTIMKKLEAQIETNPYDWNLFAYSAARYSKFIDYDLQTNKEFTIDGGVRLSKRIYDSGFGIKDKIARLKEKLAKLDAIKAKDRLSLYALQIYTQAYESQEIKEIYQRLYFNQKAFYLLIKERLKVGLSTKVDYIDAKNDLLNIKKALLAKIYEALYSDFMIRNLADLNTTKPLVLVPFGVMAPKGDLDLLFKKALDKNVEITSNRQLFELQKQYLKKSQNRYIPTLDFSSSLFYEYKKDFSYTPHKNANGLSYDVGLNLQIPLLGSMVDSNIVQKQKIAALIQKNRLLESIKKNAAEIHRTYNEIKRIEKTLSIVNEQITLMRQKIDLVKKRYVSGLSNYWQYSNALRSLLSLKEEETRLQNAFLQDEALLYTFEGKHLFYGTN